MAALPSRPGSACVGRERLAVDRSLATGELAALPADPEAAGTTNADSTPVRVFRARRASSWISAPLMGGADIRNPGRHRGDIWLAWEKVGPQGAGAAAARGAFIG